MLSDVPNNSTLAHLEKVDVRLAWSSEAGDFTPWLANNLALLNEATDMSLELEAKEIVVGSFYADILARDVTTNSWVVIENQLEQTDHTHLGQLLTYAASLKAVTIIWIATSFTDEHRAAIDWLNEVTDTSVKFFALELELWKIGDSPYAPKFNVVSSPNTLVKEGNQYKANIAGTHAINQTDTRRYMSLEETANKYGYSLEYLTKLISSKKLLTKKNDKTMLLVSSVTRYVSSHGRKKSDTSEIPALRIVGD